MRSVKARPRYREDHKPDRIDTHGIRLSGWTDAVATSRVAPVPKAVGRDRRSVVQRMLESFAAAIGGAVTAVMVFLFL